MSLCALAFLRLGSGHAWRYKFSWSRSVQHFLRKYLPSVDLVSVCPVTRSALLTQKTHDDEKPHGGFPRQLSAACDRAARNLLCRDRDPDRQHLDADGGAESRHRSTRRLVGAAFLPTVQHRLGGDLRAHLGPLGSG